MMKIAIGRCHCSDVILFYHPPTKKCYTSDSYKPDEHWVGGMLFNLICNGGLYFGVYDKNTTKLALESYPLGTSIMYKDC